jgi:hypothetical protein
MAFMRTLPILSVPLAIGVTVFCVACGGSDPSTKAGAAATPSHTKPAQDLRMNSELEKYVTDEWNHNVADPADANYAAGVTVTKVTCVPQSGTTSSTCVIAFSSGAPKKFDYLVAADGGSAERALPPG